MPCQARHGLTAMFDGRYRAIRNKEENMKKLSLIILFVLMQIFNIYAEEETGSMKDFIMKGHNIFEIDLSDCSFETLIKLFPEYSKIKIEKSYLANSPKDSTIEEYEFENFTAKIFRWKNGIKSSYGNIIFTEILEIKAKKNIIYLDGIKIGMNKTELEKKLGKINAKDNVSIHKLLYFFDLIFVFDDNNILTEISWKRQLGD